MTLESFAAKQLQQLTDRVVFELHRSAKTPAVEAIHDLRVSIRRLTQALRVYKEFAPRPASREIRKSLSAVMDAAGVVRDLDIGLEICEEAGLAADSPLRKKMAAGRSGAKKMLLNVLRRHARRSERWPAMFDGRGA